MKFCFVQSNGEKRETKQLRREKFLAKKNKTAAWKYGGLQPGNIQDKILLVSVFI